ARHVLLHRALGDDEMLGDRLVGAALRHELEHLAPARGECLEGIVGPPSATPSFSRYPTPPAESPTRSSAYPSSTYWDSTSTDVSGWLERISSAARRPSSVLVGGMRMSTTATSGLWAPTLRRSSSASPA